VSKNCGDLHRFIDGELDDAAAAGFRRHLGLCDRCRNAFERLFLTDILVEQALTEPARTETLEVAAFPHPADELASRRHRRWTMVAGLAAAACLALVIGTATNRSETIASLVAKDSYRTTVGRLGYPGLERHRPLVRERGALPPNASTAKREALLADLQERKDHHGLAVALLLDGRFDEASRELGLAGRTPAVLVDSAALAIERNDPARALSLCNEALSSQPGNAAALWNRAVALAMLDMRAEAAAAFEAVAKMAEPGWAEEARRRAAGLAAPRP
jgi:hypothetical protein